MDDNVKKMQRYATKSAPIMFRNSIKEAVEKIIKKYNLRKTKFYIKDLSKNINRDKGAFIPKEFTLIIKTGVDFYPHEYNFTFERVGNKYEYKNEKYSRYVSQCMSKEHPQGIMSGLKKAINNNLMKYYMRELKTSNNMRNYAKIKDTESDKKPDDKSSSGERLYYEEVEDYFQY